MPFPLSGLTEEQTKYAIRLNPLALAEAHFPERTWSNWHFREIVDAILEYSRVLILGPRGCIKSTLGGTIIPAWMVGCDPVNESVAFVTHTQSFSEDLVRQAKDIINEDAAYRATFPNIVADISSQSKVVLNRKKEKFVPSIEAFSVGGTVGEGRHPKHWIIDDIIDFKKRMSVAQMERAKQWLLLSLLPAVMEDQQVVMLGTRWGADDAYGFIIKDNDKKPVSKRFKIIQIPAIGEEQYPMAVKYGYVGNTFWDHPKSPWPLEALLAKKAELDLTSWMLMYQNDASLEVGREFDEEWIRDRRYKELPDLKEFTRIVGANDLAVSTRDTRHASKFASVTWAIKANGDIYCLDAYKAKLDGPNQLSAIKTRYDLFHPAQVGVEKAGQQWFVAQFAQYDPKYQMLPIVPVQQTRDKGMRIRSIIPFFAAKRVWIGSGMVDLEKELITFRGDRPEDCDLLDATEMAFRLLQTEERRRGYSRGS